jgi:hypothetical protein
VLPYSYTQRGRSGGTSFRRQLPSASAGDYSSLGAQRDSQISNNAVYDVIIGLPSEVRNAVIALLSDMHESELPRAKEHIVVCRRAWDEWNAVADRIQSGDGKTVGAEQIVRRNRYLLARARILYFDAFEYRGEWKRERERQWWEGPDGEGSF